MDPKELRLRTCIYLGQAPLQTAQHSTVRIHLLFISCSRRVGLRGGEGRGGKEREEGGREGRGGKREGEEVMTMDVCRQVGSTQCRVYKLSSTHTQIFTDTKLARGRDHEFTNGSGCHSCSVTLRWRQLWNKKHSRHTMNPCHSSIDTTGELHV